VLRYRCALNMVLAGVVSVMGACARTPTVVTPQGVDEYRAKLDNSGPGSLMFGQCPNFSQVGNGRFLAAISRDWGRFARAGAIISWNWPHYSKNRLRVSTVGIRVGNRFRWLDELDLVGQEVVADTGRVVSRFREKEGRFEVIVEDVAHQDLDVLLRRVRVRNVSSAALIGVEVVAYANYAMTLTGQGDRINWQSQDQALVHANASENCAAAFGADRTPDRFQCGVTGLAIGASRSAANDAESGFFHQNTGAGGLAGANGALGVTLNRIERDATDALTIHHSMGRSPDDALALLKRARETAFDDAAQADGTFYRNWLAKAQNLGRDGQERETARRALIVLKQLQADTGGMLASASTISPAYKYVWLQDLAADVRALSACGYFTEARQALDFVARTQKLDGDWWVTYRGDGSPFKLWDHGSEWMGGHWLSAVADYVATSGDRAAGRAWWPAIKTACDFMTQQIQPHGLLGINMDLWETFKDHSWTYTNGSFVGGLESAAEVAEQIGEANTARLWRESAKRLREAILRDTVVEDGGWFGKGRKPNASRANPVIDASVLGLAWPFKVVEAEHPVMQRTVLRIREKLLQSGGGVRRWETDRWYGGEGWCELTDWLALVALQAGDQALAQRLHTANTGKAATTGSKQLGEVFDERTGRFPSAFPLGWAEAQYIMTTLALQGKLRPDGRFNP